MNEGQEIINEANGLLQFVGLDPAVQDVNQAERICADICHRLAGFYQKKIRPVLSSP